MRRLFDEDMGFDDIKNYFRRERSKDNSFIVAVIAVIGIVALITLATVAVIKLVKKDEDDFFDDFDDDDEEFFIDESSDFED